MRCFLNHYAGSGERTASSAALNIANADSDVICDEEAIDQIRM
jgi:hypothetical protein